MNEVASKFEDDIEVEQEDNTPKCPVCGNTVYVVGHCATCPSCGFSLCSL